MPRLYREDRKVPTNYTPVITVAVCVLAIIVICALIYFIARVQ